MEPIETYEHSGVQVQILLDEDGRHADPRDADNLGHMYAYHPDYKLGDTELPRDGLPEIDCPRCEGTGVINAALGKYAPGSPEDQADCERCEGAGMVEPTVQEWLANEKAIAVMPLFLYDHSGLSMRGGRLIWLADEQLERSDTQSSDRFPLDSAGWDTSFVGFMIVTKERVIELCGDDPKYQTREFIAEAFEVDIAEYDRYLSGEVFGYVVAAGTSAHDSCWGFLGFEHVKSEANEAAECAARALAKETNERSEWAARDVMTCGS